MKRTLTAVALGAGLVLTGCGSSQPARQQVPQQGLDLEDCDREDALKGERDECSQSQIDRARKAASAKPKAPSKPTTKAKPPTVRKPVTKK